MSPYVPLQQEEIHERADTLLLVGLLLRQMSRFHVQLRALLPAVPPREKREKAPARKYKSHSNKNFKKFHNGEQIVIVEGVMTKLGQESYSKTCELMQS